MKWFGVDKKESKQVEKKAAIEIVASKAATEKTIREAEEASRKLNNLLVENGFTIKIYLAAGGKLQTRPRKKTV
jgi:hypothetical protein